MATPNYQQVLDSEANRLVNELAELRSMIQHTGSKGTAVEQMIAGMLRRFIPDDYVITSGFVFNERGKLSPQQDILVVRNDRVGPLGHYAGFGVYPIENVMAAIEVKTTLTTAELDSALNSLEKISGLAPNVPGHNPFISNKPGYLLRAKIPICGPFTAIVALETNVQQSTILSRAKAHSTNLKIGTRVNLIQVLDHSATCWVDRSAGKLPNLIIDPQAKNVAGTDFDWEGRQLELAASATTSKEAMQVLLGLLLSFLNWYQPPQLQIQNYIFKGLKLSF
jgi:hypothetical protein